MWCSCVAVPYPHSFIAIVWVETGTTMHTCHISRWRPTGNSVIKTITWRELCIYRELSTLSRWCRHKLRKTLISDSYCWIAEVPFKAVWTSSFWPEPWFNFWYCQNLSCCVTFFAKAAIIQLFILLRLVNEYLHLLGANLQWISVSTLEESDQSILCLKLWKPELSLLMLSSYVLEV